MQHSKPTIIRVAVPSPLRRTFDYTLPHKSDSACAEDEHNKDECNKEIPHVGSRVAVHFGRRKVIGLVTEIATESDFPIEKQTYQRCYR